MKYIVVWTLQRGSLDPPEVLSEEEARKIEQSEYARKLAARENRWWERCEYEAKG